MDKKDTEIFSLELKIAKFLRMGILVAGFFIFLGWLARFSLSDNPFEKYKTYSKISFFDMAEVSFMTNDWAFFVAYAGLFILILLPIIRVFLTGILFFRQKEKAMGTMAFIVLFFLLLSFVFGFEI